MKIVIEARAKVENEVAMIQPINLEEQFFATVQSNYIRPGSLNFLQGKRVKVTIEVQ